MSLVSFAPVALATTTTNTILYQIDDLGDTVTTTEFINGIAQTPTTATESSSVVSRFSGAPDFTAPDFNLGPFNIYDPNGVTLSDTIQRPISII
jgi:hypothetical protein